MWQHEIGELSPAALPRFRLVAGGTLEVTLSQFWSSLGQGDLDVSLSFHGLEARCPGGGAFLDGSHGNLKVLLRCERICWLLDFVVRLGHHADLRIHVYVGGLPHAFESIVRDDLYLWASASLL